MGTLQKPRNRVGLGLGVAVALAVIAVALVMLVVVGVIATIDPFGSESVDRSGPAVLEQIRELEEFTAAESSFTQDVDIEQDSNLLPGFLRGERVVAMVTGTVRATVDLGGLDEDAIEVSDDGTTIRIRLPEPQLTDAEIDESSARIISRDRGLIDRVEDFFVSNPTDDGEIYRAAESKLEQAARESDVLEQARTNTERWLRTFLGAAGFDTVEITWQAPPA